MYISWHVRDRVIVELITYIQHFLILAARNIFLWWWCVHISTLKNVLHAEPNKEDSLRGDMFEILWIPLLFYHY